MPIPTPRSGEGRMGFIARFMAETKKDTALSREQRLAIAYDKWRTYQQEQVGAQQATKR